MLSKYFCDAHRIGEVRGGPAGALIEGFADVLFRSGYALITARRHIRSAEHIVRSAGDRDFCVSSLDDELLKRFGRHLSRCHCGRYACVKRLEVVGGARLFLRYLQGVTAPAIMEPPPASRDPAVLEEFCEWMRAQRGTQEVTLDNYRIPLRALLRDCSGAIRGWVLGACANSC